MNIYLLCRPWADLFPISSLLSLMIPMLLPTCPSIIKWQDTLIVNLRTIQSRSWSNTMKSLYLCLTVFVVQSSAQLGSLFGSNACKSVEDTYFKTDPTACAVLFDEDDCGGWAKTIAKGELISTKLDSRME